MKNSDLFNLLEKVLSRPIAFHRIFASIAGGATEGLFLSQAYYWSKHTNDADGWFYKTGEHWERETCLTRREQETARKALKQLGILEEVRKGLPRQVFYRINRDVLYQMICDHTSSNPCGSQFAKSDKQASQKRQTSKSKVTNSNVISDNQDGTNRTGSNVISGIPSIYTEITSETKTESNPESKNQDSLPQIKISNSEDPNTQSTAPLITKTESSVKQITPHGDGYSARPLQSIYTQAANVWELVDLCLDSPDLADAKPPSELLAVYNEKYRWSQWRWPWRSLNKTRDFGTFNPDVVIKLAKKLASEEKGAILEQKYQYAINILSNWEQTKGGWEKMIGYCDRPVDQDIAESVEEVTETPKHIKGWHDSYHEVLHEKFRAARSLEAFFKKDKDNEPWYRFAKEKFPSWDWSK